MSWILTVKPRSSCIRCLLQVQQLPAFIEWDVTGSEGPILHPLPSPEDPAPPTPGIPSGRHMLAWQLISVHCSSTGQTTS